MPRVVHAVKIIYRTRIAGRIIIGKLLFGSWTKKSCYAVTQGRSRSFV